MGADCSSFWGNLQFLAENCVTLHKVALKSASRSIKKPLLATHFPAEKISTFCQFLLPSHFTTASNTHGTKISIGDNQLRTKVSGLTLLELLISLLLIAVVLNLAVPGFRELLDRNALQTGADRFFNALLLTRSEALKRNQVAILCKSSDGASCTTSGNWEQGWLVFADIDADATPDPNEILRVDDGLREGRSLRVATGDFSNAVNYRTDGTASGTGTFVLCNAKQNLTSAREVEVNITGRPRLKVSTTDCTP